MRSSKIKKKSIKNTSDQDKILYEENKQLNEYKEKSEKGKFGRNKEIKRIRSEDNNIKPEEKLLKTKRSIEDKLELKHKKDNRKADEGTKRLKETRNMNIIKAKEKRMIKSMKIKKIQVFFDGIIVGK